MIRKSAQEPPPYSILCPMPRVSIIIPVHNREDLLVETLDSVKAQTFADWECVVVDDHSSDCSFGVAQRYAREDGRFRALALPTSKLFANAARNLGFAKSSGNYIIFLDSDDLLAPWCLANRVRAMDEDVNLDFALFRGEVFDQIPGDRRMLCVIDNGDNDIDRFLRGDVPWVVSSPIWTRSALERVGKWDERLRRFQDWEFHLRSIVAGFTYRRFKKIDMHIRNGDARLSKTSENGRKDPHFAYRDPRFLCGMESAVVRIQNLLFSNGKLDSSRRRRLLAYQYFDLADKWCNFSAHRKALRVWSRSKRGALISSFEYGQGVFLLWARRVRVVRFFVRKYLIPRWKDVLGRIPPSHWGSIAERRRLG